jgi:hypothetical protein
LDQEESTTNKAINIYEAKAHLHGMKILSKDRIIPEYPEIGVIGLPYSRQVSK